MHVQHAGALELLREVPERAGAVGPLGKRRVELQQRRLEQAELRRDFAFGEDLERARHERDRLLDRRAVAPWFTPAGASRRTGAVRRPGEVLVGDELVTVLLQDLAGERAAADDEHLLVVLFQLLDQADEIAVTADDDERIDVRVGERHLERVEREVDVRAVLVAAGREVALHHADGVLREHAAVAAGPLPVAVGGLGDDLAALLEGLEDEAGVEGGVERVLDADFDVVEVDENSNTETFVAGHRILFGKGVDVLGTDA